MKGFDDITDQELVLFCSVRYDVQQNAKLAGIKLDVQELDRLTLKKIEHMKLNIMDVGIVPMKALYIRALANKAEQDMEAKDELS